MIFWLAKLLNGWFGWDIVKLQKRLILTFIGVVIIVVICLGLWLKSCLHHEPKLDEKAIQKAEQAVKDRNDAVLKEILIESDVKDAQIDANVANAAADTANAIHEAKQKYSNMNTDELAAEIERRKNQ